MPIKNEVLALVQDLAQRRHILTPPGANEEDIAALSNQLGVVVPQDLHDWLRMCNAPRVIRGRILGVVSQQPFIDIAAYASIHPGWKEKGWIPIAVDESGDTYVAATRSTGGSGTPVLFIDHELDDDNADYVVASGVWRFLRFLLEREQQVLSLGKLSTGNDEDWDEEYDRVVFWPFVKEKVIAQDPNIQTVTDASMPWEE